MNIFIVFVCVDVEVVRRRRKPGSLKRLHIWVPPTRTIGGRDLGSWGLNPRPVLSPNDTHTGRGNLRQRVIDGIRNPLMKSNVVNCEDRLHMRRYASLRTR